MSVFERTDGVSLTKQVEEQIIQMLRSESFPSNKLPPEKRLVERFGVSLAVIREALLVLSEKRIITKKHGSGNYIHQSTLRSYDMLNQFPDFYQQLSALGYEVTDKVMQMFTMQPSEKVRKALQIDDEEEVLYFERIIYANGSPAVHCEDYYPAQLFPKGIKRISPSSTILDIFSAYLDKEPAVGQLEFIPYISTELEREQLNVPAGLPMVAMATVYFSLEDIPIVYGYSKVNHDYLKLKTLI